MIQKVTASVLLWLMTMVVAMGQPGLRYCTCLHEIFIGDCHCFEENEEALESLFFSTSQKFGDIASSDCIKELSLKVEHSSANISQEIRDNAKEPLLQPLVVFSETHWFATSRRAAINITRGPPSAYLVDSTVPLYLRHLVFLV